MAERNNLRRSKRLRNIEAGDLRWVQPPRPRPGSKKYVTFRVEGGTCKRGGGGFYSKFYFISIDSLLSSVVDRTSIGECILVSTKPPFRSATIHLYNHRCSPYLPSNLSRFCTAAVADDCLFVMRGKDVYCLDFQNMVWKTRRSMNFHKYHPQAFSLDSKIYVFGSGNEPGSSFVEVYSPGDDIWASASVNKPPCGQVEPILGVMTDSNKSKHILVQPGDGDTDLYTYSIANQNFTLQKRYRPFYWLISRSATVQGILYSYREGDIDGEYSIVGHDLTGDQTWGPIPVLGFSPHVELAQSYIQLLPLFDDMLCVFWTDHEYSVNFDDDDDDDDDSISDDDDDDDDEETYDNMMLVVVMTFKMSKLERNPETCLPNEPSILLQASHVSSSCYQVPGHDPVLDCLVL